MQSVIYQSYTSGLNSEILNIISLVSVLFGIYVIISKNPIISVLFLVGLFFNISVYLILIGLHFLGLSYLIVYVGAISVLFIFIVMLINVRISELLTENNNSLLLAILTVLCFNYSISANLSYSVSLYDIINSSLTYNLSHIYDILSSGISRSNNDVITSLAYLLSLFNIGEVDSRSWDTIMITSTHISSVGNILHTNLFVLFIITSLILTLAIIGAIIITIKKPNSSNIKNNKITYNISNSYKS